MRLWRKYEQINICRGLSWFREDDSLSYSTKEYAINNFCLELLISLKKKFSDIKAEIGHLKLIATTGNSSLQGNITALDSKEELKGDLEKASEWLLIINARIRLKPEKLKDVVLEPPYLIRE